MARSRSRSALLPIVASLALVCALAVIGAGAAFGRSASPVSALAAPSTRTCVSAGTLTITIRRVSGVRLTGVRVKLNGRPLKVLSSAQLAKPVKLKGLPVTGSYSLSFTISARRSRSVTTTLRYRACTPTLKVTRAGSGSGNVSGNGIACPSNCSHSYKYGTKVTLRATANSGSTFAGWKGGGCAGAQTCTVKVTGAETVIADFTKTASTTTPPGPQKLTVTTSGAGKGTVTANGGISCPTTCSETYTYGTQVTLTATPAAGSVFAGWSGGCSGTGTCTVTMKAAQNVTATFAVQQFTTAQPGSYSGSASSDNGGQAVTFSVNSNGTQIQNVVANTYLVCNPSAPAVSNSIQIPSIAINADGSFDGTSSTTGVFDSTPATFTYTFVGHFHGLTSTGTQRVAGQLREDITYGSGPTITCSSDVMPWSAAS
jgi:hypothetical protein